MTKDEALKMAIEAFVRWEDTYKSDCTEVINACKEALEQPSMTYEQGFDHGYEAHGAEQMADACKEALEQPAQEPVAWIQTFENQNGETKITFNPYPVGINDIAVYTHPHQWQGLTDDEIGNLITPYEYSVHPDLDGFARAIEQALKEKNT
jgi:hypothetical protein